MRPAPASHPSQRATPRPHLCADLTPTVRPTTCLRPGERHIWPRHRPARPAGRSTRHSTGAGGARAAACRCSHTSRSTSLISTRRSTSLSTSRSASRRTRPGRVAAGVRGRGRAGGRVAQRASVRRPRVSSSMPHVAACAGAARTTVDCAAVARAARCCCSRHCSSRHCCSRCCSSRRCCSRCAGRTP